VHRTFRAAGGADAALVLDEGIDEGRITSCTGAAGTLPANSSIHSAVVRAESAASSSTVSLSRLASRALKSL